MNIKICPICAIVSGTWLILSAGVAWDHLNLSAYLAPIALLMGGTVVGVAYQGEKKLYWASKHPLLWKMLVVFLGMPIAYLLVNNLNKQIVIIELVSLILISYFFFVNRPAKPGELKSNEKIRDIEEQMDKCC